MNTETNISRADAVRHLIVCDSQFAWAGQTTLQLSEMLDLRDRGWIAEGDENWEYELTDAGRAVVEQALQLPAPAGMASTAVEKLSAQIGVAIFGEPVTNLIELANRCNRLRTASGGKCITQTMDEAAALMERDMGALAHVTASTDVEKVAQPEFPLVELLDIRNQLHVMATTVVPNFCDLAAGLQGQVQGLIDAHRKLYPEQQS